VEIKEVNDTQGKGASASTTVGGLFIFHHAIMTVEAAGGAGGVNLGGGWPIHEVGRNADVFSPEAGKLLKAGSRVGFPNVHMHANGKDTTGHLEVAFKFHLKGYQPKMNERTVPIGTATSTSVGNEARRSRRSRTFRSRRRSPSTSRTCTPPPSACASTRSGVRASRR
jgi:hypothetical protein